MPNAPAIFWIERVPVAATASLLALALLAGCADAGQTDGTAATPAPVPVETAGATAPAGSPQPATPDAASGETIGGDGSQIRLDGLGEQDIRGAELAGELACSFASDGQPPILFAMGVVGASDPAQGVVKVAGYVEPIRAPGGFDGMLENPTFTGQGKTIEIAVTGPASDGGESPARPATLTYQRADGASRRFDGRWQCGP